MKIMILATAALSLVAAVSMLQAQPEGADEFGTEALNATADYEFSTGLEDKDRDAAHPARNRQLLVPSHGQGMNALFLLAAGEGPKPTMLLLHGLPGNEQNLDLAQAVRRKGWNVLTLHYRGSWGSPGQFSIAGAIEDAEAAMVFLRRPETIARYAIDPKRLVIAGHSMGGAAAALYAAKARQAGDPPAGLLLIDSWNIGTDAARLAKGGAPAVAGLESEINDLGNSLQGATPASLAREVRDRGAGWELGTLAPKLAGMPVFTIYATHGIREDNRTLARKILAENARSCAPGREEHCAERLWAREIGSDHAFADKRLELTGWVLRWLERWFQETGPDTLSAE